MTHSSAPRVPRQPRAHAVTLVLALLIGLLSIGAAPASSEPGGAPPTHDWLQSSDRDQHPPALAPALWDDADRGRPTPSADQRAVAGDGATVVVEASDAKAATRAVEDAGGTVKETLTDRVKAVVPAEALDGLAAADGVRRVREPNPVRLDAQSEGVGTTNADDWQSPPQAHTGQSVKIAILDSGFSGYESRLGTELPATVETDFSRCGGTPDATEHGTAVSEIVADMAPGATLRLVCIVDDVDFVSALATMAANGVQVVNGSFGFFLASRGDGSGGPSTIAGAVASLRAQGILYVASAGNSGDRHYNVAATGDPTPAVAFADPADSFGDLVNISDGDVFEVTVAPGGVVFVGLQWDAWPITRQDFDLYVGNNSCGLAGASEGDQTTAPGSEPVEGVVFQNCQATTQVFEVVVNRWSGVGTQRLDFFFDGDVLGIENTTGGSVADPATSPAVMAVGAHCWSTGAAQAYSSRGPTIDGRTKPDISGPDATSGSVYGPYSGCLSGFTGTSASAPHTAGAAALLLDDNSDLDVAELQQLLEEKAADAGAAGDDNVYGAGRLQLGAPHTSTPRAAQPFTGISPVRLFDSRPGTRFPAESPNRTAPLGPGGKVRVQVTDIVGVPDSAVAVVLNVTAVAPTTAGYLTVHPGGVVPNASNLNFAAGQTVAVHVTATVASDGTVELFNAFGSTHVVVDIAGWYGPDSTTGPAVDRFTPLASPARAMDTRPVGPRGYAEPSSGTNTPIPSASSLDVQVAGLGGIPADATAVIMNVTAVKATRGTFITAYPFGQSLPVASNVNLKAGQTVANLVVIPVGTNGKVTFYNAAGNTHLVVDVVGWFRPNVGAGYVALDPPTRDLDTRTGTGLRRGALSADSTYALTVARYDGVPADAAAVMLSVVAVTPTSGGYLTVYPGSAPVPGTSNLNFSARQTVANAVVARPGSDGTVGFFNRYGSTNVVNDLAGYFIDPADQPIHDLDV